jgi:phosphoribosylformylglycinamidine cyclo-ligase
MDQYARAGVDIEAGARAVALIKSLAARATRAEVRSGIGGFAGVFEISPDRYLVAATDGVGTKCEIARKVWKLNTVGVDLVAMCVDDVACVGAEPLFFLDYVSVGKVIPEEVASIVEGVATGCALANCALLGGETAEHPGTMEPGQFDLAGFCVGVVAKDAMLGPGRVEEGDILVGLESSGLHSNGFSLVRKVLLEDGPFRLDQTPFGFWRPLGLELMEPTRIYSPLILDLNARGLLHAAAHITGGGLYENVPRVLPAGLGAFIDSSSWTIPPIFDLVQEAAGGSHDDMFRVLNMGIGMVLAVAKGNEDEVLSVAQQSEYRGWVIGEVGQGSGLTLRS